MVAEPGLHKNAFLVLAQNLQRLARGQRGFPGNTAIDQNRYRNRFHKPRTKRPANRSGRPGDFLIEALEVVFEFLFLRSRRRFDFLAFFAFGGGFLLLLGGAQLGGRDLLKSLLGEFREFRSLLRIPDGLLLLLLGDQSQTLGLRAGGLLFRQAIRKTPHRASHQDENQNQRHRSHDRGGLVPADQFSREVESGDRSRRNRLASPKALQIRQQRGNAPVAIVWHGAKTLQDDDLQIGIDRRIQLPRAHRLVRLQRLDVGEEISTRCEMPPPGAHLVEDRSQRIDIGARVHTLARFGLLRCHVLDRANHIATHGKRAPVPAGLAGQFRQTEIRDERLAIGAKKDVAGLQIAVQHAMLVRKLHRLTNFFHQPHGLLGRQRQTGCRSRRSGFRIRFGRLLVLFHNRAAVPPHGGDQRGEVGGFSRTADRGSGIGIEDFRKRQALDEFHREEMRAILLTCFKNSADVAVRNA